MATGANSARKSGPVLAVLRLFGAQVAAVVAIATLITVVVAVLGADDLGRGTGPDQSPQPAPATASSPDTGSAPAGSPSASGASTPPASTSEPATASPVPAPVDVDVLNQSAGAGAAARTADRLRSAGWTIGRVDDFQGNVSTTTVYWLDPPQRRQARQVSRFLGGVRVRRGFETLRAGRVTVILVEPR